MTSYNIFTEDLLEISGQCTTNTTDIELDKPVIYMVQTDSYSSDAMSSFRKLLSESEIDKASRFRFALDQQRYIVTHAILRTILGSYLKSKPKEIEFISNDFGKLSLPEKYKKIYFNMSHSEELSALAFSTISEIGIDIEKIDPEYDLNLIAKAHFSEAENNFLNAEDDQVRNRFYTVWTRKEALLKAVGTGIGENIGIEVFKKINHCIPEKPFPGAQNEDFYLKSFLFQQNYMISTASNNSDKFTCSLINV